MNNTLTQEEKNKVSKILSMPYWLHHASEDGAEYRITLTGDERVVTVCPLCNKEFSFDLREFCDIVSVGDFCFYSTMIFCTECSAKREAARR